MNPPAAPVSMSASSWGLTVLLALTWGSSFMFFELGLEGFAPLTLVFLRVSIGAMFAAVLFGVSRQRLGLIVRHWRLMLFLGFFSSAAPFAFYAYGMLYVDSSLASVVNALMPLCTFLLAVTQRQEHFDRFRLGGLLLGIAGVVVLLGPVQGDDPKALLGTLLCMAAPMMYAVSTVTVRHYSGRIDPGTIALGMLAGATVIALPVALLVDGLPARAPVGTAVLGAVCVGLIGTAIAYKIFMYLIHRVGATNASIAVLLIPFVATMLGVVVLDEQLSPSFFVATGLIVTSVVFVDVKLRSLLLRRLLKRA